MVFIFKYCQNDRNYDGITVYPSLSSWFPVKEKMWAPGLVLGELRLEMETILGCYGSLSMRMKASLQSHPNKSVFKLWFLRYTFPTKQIIH